MINKQNNEAIFEYFKKIKEVLKNKNYNEHSFRTPLENLFNTIKDNAIKIIHEPKSEEGEGSIRPDFKVYKQIDSETALSYNALMGFVECKGWDSDLDKHIKSVQLDKYLAICPNILLTNYNRFILLSFDKILYDVTLFPYSLEENLFTSENLDNGSILEFFALMNDFFNAVHSSIKSKAELVRILSTQSFYLGVKAREFYKTLPRTTFHKFFEKTYETFKSITHYNLSQEDFCDILGQSVVYGLLVAHLETENKDIEITDIQNFVNLLPKEFLLLAEFIYFSIPNFHIPKTIAFALENIKKTIALIDKTNLAKMLNTDIESISIYLYEDFLKAYDDLKGSEKRKEGGVFYTPEPVVNCITSSLHSVLKKDFEKPKGFGDSGVKVLDFATGTGSFLAKVFELILQEEKSNVWKREAIKDKFLKDIYGFELSFVPYIVAHIKLSNILKNVDFSNFSDENKLQIFLTNTLDLSASNDVTMTIPLILLDEQQAQAREIKHNQELLVILGNPPYNNRSKNNLPEIQALLGKYKQGLNETKINLDDDYIKFMRFAEWKLLERYNPMSNQLPFVDSTYFGLMGFVTNNSFIWGRTHRKMRESFFENFDKIYILNLHGDNEKDDKEDENVFDIRVGVCISLFVKYPKSTHSPCEVLYYSTADNKIFKRKDKFALLNEVAFKGLDCLSWKQLECNEPYFWFIEKNLHDEEYESFWALAEDKALKDCKAIFEVFNSGIDTNVARYGFVYGFNQECIKESVETFINMSANDLRELYQIDDSKSRDWKVEWAKDDIMNNQGQYIKVSYRPFDFRYSYYTGTQCGFMANPGRRVLSNMLCQNLGLIFPKTACNLQFDYGLIIDSLCDRALGGKNTGSETYIAPLYCYIDSESEIGKIGKIPNFTKEFVEYCKKHKILKDKTPEQILAFIYANLYNPQYRVKYSEYLKIGFPRINFEIPLERFEKLEKIGSRLIKLHLLDEVPQCDEIELDFNKNADKENPSRVIAKLNVKNRFVENKVILNNDLCILGISDEIYNYTIGGYKVIEKWLGYRNGYECSREEIDYLVNVCKVIKETISIQKELMELK